VSKHNIVIRMSAARWTANVRREDGTFTEFDFRKMERKDRSTFHREFMNAFRASRSRA
jgi:hypothetical protein